MMGRSLFAAATVCLSLFFAGSAMAAEVDKPAATGLAAIKVPEGFTVEPATPPGLVEHPMMACFDERGRLFIAETAGRNLKRADLEKELPNFIRMIEDTDGDGVFDKSTIFADKLTFPQGVLWHDGSVYTCSSGALWKLTDTDNDGVADRREKLVGDFGYTGNAADIHGPFLGPDGRLYICEGRHGHEVRDKDGKLISKGKAARIFSCKTDGSDFRSFCGGGFDNPVEVVFTDEGDMLGTVNLMYHQPRGDCLVHWVYGGVYPRTDFIDQLKSEFYFTGELLGEVHNYGHVAVSGLCRYRSEHFGLEGRAKGQGPGAKEAEDNPQSAIRNPQSPIHLFITQFNTHKIVHTTLERSGSTYKTAKNEDFLVSESIDFHPTDVLEDADGSLLVIDTGGWFRIGCPVSQVEKPGVKGAIYRIRKSGGKRYEDPRGLKLDWARADLGTLLIMHLNDERFAVRDRATRQMLNFAHAGVPHLPDTRAPALLRVADMAINGSDLSLRHRAVQAIRDLTIENTIRSPISKGLIPGQEPGTHDVPDAYMPGFNLLLKALARADNDRLVEHAIIYALIEIGDAEATAEGLKSDNERVRRGAAIALEQMRRTLSLTQDKPRAGPQIPPPEFGTKLEKEAIAKLDALAVESKDKGEAASGKKVFESQKAACSACHRVGDKGAEVGLNLTRIGAIRSERDLLESILHPSASFARGFEPFQIRTKAGDIVTGVISRESADAIHLRHANNAEAIVKLTDIDKIEASKLSIMPQNYGELLSKEELADLISYLASLR
ncbi:MAG: c-type cytochrome [Phycisphaeraceae bacterium]